MSQPLTIWLTGLSGSGKSSFAKILRKRMKIESLPCVILDGDVVRTGLCSDLSYTREDRAESNRRVAEVAKILNDTGVCVICAVISPMQKDRQHAKSIIGAERFKEVFLSAPLGICETRDSKGLYAKARNCEIKEFTGITAPYEEPASPDMIIPYFWSAEDASDLAYQVFFTTHVDT